MDPALLLFISIVINVLLFRWAFREYQHRRQWQKEAIFLQKALRSIKQDSKSQASGSSLLLWFLFTILFFGIIWLLAIT